MNFFSYIRCDAILTYELLINFWAFLTATNPNEQIRVYDDSRQTYFSLFSKNLKWEIFIKNIFYLASVICVYFVFLNFFRGPKVDMNLIQLRKW